MFGGTFSTGQAVIPRDLMIPPVGAPARKELSIPQCIAIRRKWKKSLILLCYRVLCSTQSEMRIYRNKLKKYWL